MSASRTHVALSITEWTTRPCSSRRWCFTTPWNALTRSSLAIALVATGFSSIGCHRSRLFNPLNSRSSLERHANQGPSDIFISGENASPETLPEEVPQRLATSKTPADAKNAPQTHSQTYNGPRTQARPATETAAQADSRDLSRSNSNATTQQVSFVSDSDDPIFGSDAPRKNSSNAERSATSPRSSEDSSYAGVDLSMIEEALKNHPPAVRREAIRRLMAMSWKKAQSTQQPTAIDQVIASSLDSLPTLPDEVIDRGLTPQRIAADYRPKHPAADSQSPSPQSQSPQAPSSETQNAIANIASAMPAAKPFDAPEQETSEFSFTDQVIENAFAELRQDKADGASAIAQTSTEQASSNGWSFSDKTPAKTSVAATPASFSMNDQSTTEPQTANQPAFELPQTNSNVPATNDVQQVAATRANEDTKSDQVAQAVQVETLSDSELYDALLHRLTQPVPNETEAQKQRRQIIQRHLMVLSGDPDRAVDKLEGLTTQEQEYLRHQLLGLWTIIDPNGHPVPSRRFSSALPQIRQATEFLAAATDSLEVRSLEFCTEIEAYGQIKPFPKRQFTPGQQVILYCEIENFVSKKAQSDGTSGFETMLQGSYDLLDESGQRVASQSLPVDKQISKNKLRDYFIAYQMYLPDSLGPGSYRLRLTMEDVHGKKYGQNELPFEIKR
ncbi:hypothetical protein LOC71_23795 [Rhodopirellula sp. JC740]|uniref:Secreted protein n=1 Tax=Rhodopirellula halodulae TaxID=2894198 RepID=A0ABS8NNZ3_9BACT|nr:hypothetical protein [Rhodopirellula sp. JC740]MCC9645314.1 hypothetical protein [Rhodopirellula sp. JC740]